MDMDMIFTNGRFYSMAKEGETFEAMAVRDGKIADTGTNEEMTAYGSGSVTDLNGKTVLPGFIDSHIHLLSYCEGKGNVDLSGAKSLEELKGLLKARAEVTPEGKWITGVGFDHEHFPDKKFPDKCDLDSVSRTHPIFISRYCMHGHAANSLAMKLAGITDGYSPEVEGSAIRNENGELTGVLWENSALPVIKTVPEYLDTYESKLEAVRQASLELSACGITGVTPIQGKACQSMEYLGIYQQLAERGELTVRVYAAFDEFPSFDIRSGFGNDMVKYGFFKIYSDGSLGSRTAALFEPYSDDPGNTGILIYSRGELESLVAKVYRAGLQVGIHAIGDRAMDMVVGAMEKSYYADPRKDYRFRLIHSSVLTPGILERMKKLPLVLDVQPSFVSTDLPWIEKRLGKERAELTFAWKTLMDSGLVLTGSADAPVESFNPLLGIYSAVTRRGWDGSPAEGWNPQEKLTPYEAVCLYTKNAAYASYEEKKKGTLEKGKFADFAVLNEDIFRVEPEKIRSLYVEQTYLGGARVYGREG